jgi:hypothetical protein
VPSRAESFQGDEDPPPLSQRSLSRRGGSGRRRAHSHGDQDNRRHRGGRSSSRKGLSSLTSSSSSSQARVKSHASKIYLEQPMLCQFVWKKELEKAQRAAGGKLNDGTHAAEGGGSLGGGGGNVSVEAGGTAFVAADRADPHCPPPLFESQEAEDAAYRGYNAKYCLNYVCTFFNHHLDDPWFRSRLSPLEAYRQAVRERKRALAEACEMRREIVQSLEDTAKGVIPKKDPNSPE